MASTVLQLNLQKCSKFTPSILSIIQNKFETTTALGTVTNISKNFAHKRSLCYLTPKNIPQSKQTNFHRKWYAAAHGHHGLLPVIYRTYATNPTNEDDRQSNKLPTLMEFPKIMWPSLLKTIKSWILCNFIIRPYFDQEFDMPNFVNGTKHAIQVSSRKRQPFQLHNC